MNNNNYPITEDDEDTEENSELPKLGPPSKIPQNSLSSTAESDNSDSSSHTEIVMPTEESEMPMLLRKNRNKSIFISNGGKKPMKHFSFSGKITQANANHSPTEEFHVKSGHKLRNANSLAVPMVSLLQNINLSKAHPLELAVP